jgi:uncharacterized membrane protein
MKNHHRVGSKRKRRIPKLKNQRSRKRQKTNRGENSNEFYSINQIKDVRKVAGKYVYQVIFTGYEDSKKEYWLPKKDLTDN